MKEFNGLSQLLAQKFPSVNGPEFVDEIVEKHILDQPPERRAPTRKIMTDRIKQRQITLA
jgi:hypothetical protein